MSAARAAAVAACDPLQGLLAPWAAKAGEPAAQRLRQLTRAAILQDLPTAEVVRRFLASEPAEEACEALKAARLRASLESLL